MDDVIRIRIDTTRAVEAFLTLLVEQAAEGETRAPANPAATAIWRELAPFRLVEYAYVDDGVGTIVGAYLGFPDGELYAAGDDIPETAVTDMVKGCEHSVTDLPPIYVYVVLERPVGREAIDAFLTELSSHVGHALTAVVPGSDGQLKVRFYDSEGARGFAREGDRHLSKAAVLERFATHSQRSDGRAYAALTYAYAKQVLEFASAQDRDEFIAWSRSLCDWIFAHGGDSAQLGFPEVTRPAEAAPVPEEDRVTARMEAPGAFENGEAWNCFATDASPTDEVVARSYWAYVRRTIDEGRAGTVY
ncbi:hypothetical protein CU669_07030 [Paramagnetospirillum kuznetsovii]|uniref:Uncharacterized protein n=2 Tax=Paramagnetospirillum kuznetsovii TaxID=2053833 RepID=A0A364NZE5_9PROT|nr:hypothetical protein CU669_07030 [Paramagnetospirillum kuznetsovii]